MKKEEKKQVKEGTIKFKIQELKKTSRGKAILRLIKWCIFFLILFIFLIIASLVSPKDKIQKSPVNNVNKEPIENNPEEKNETLNKETLNIEDITRFQNKLSNIFDYNYDIKINNEKYIFNGTKTKIENTGYKESSSGIIKYIIDSGGTYMETTTSKTPITNLYEGLEENYLDPIFVLNIIKDLAITRDYECDCIEPVYKANDSKNIYRLTTNDNELTSISITALDFSYKYTLSFSNIK